MKMTTEYTIKRCKMFGFSKELNYILKNVNDEKIYCVTSRKIIYSEDSEEEDNDSTSSDSDCDCPCHTDKSSDDEGKKPHNKKSSDDEGKKPHNNKKPTNNRKEKYTEDTDNEHTQYNENLDCLDDVIDDDKEDCDYIPPSEQTPQQEEVECEYDNYNNSSDDEVKDERTKIEAEENLFASEKPSSTSITIHKQFRDRILKIDKLYKIKNISSKRPTIAIDLQCDLFDDIKISVNNSDKNKTNTKYQLDKKGMEQIFAGNSSQLDAFTHNTFAVIYGKRSACIDPLHFKQNHIVIDSLARNGVFNIPSSSKILSLNKLMEYLRKFKCFKIYAIHEHLDIKFIEHDYPSDISHPSYEICKGEINAIFYRYLLGYYYGYCGIITESMREYGYNF